MIPRKKIQLVLCTLCILYAVGNGRRVSPGPFETSHADHPGSIDDNTNLDSTGTTNAYLQADTTVEYPSTTQDVEETSSIDNTSQSASIDDSTILDSTGTTNAYLQADTTVEYPSTTQDIEETSSIDNTSQSASIDDSTSLDSTGTTNAYLQSDTTVEYPSTTQDIEETSSVDNTSQSINQSDETTTELLYTCEGTPINAVQNLTVLPTNTTIFVTWESVTFRNECISEFNIMWYYSDSNSVISDTINSTQSEFTISDLTPCRYYPITVTAIGPSGVSEAQTITGNTSESLISQVNNLTVTNIENGLIANWSPPDHESCLLKYLVNLIKEDNVTRDAETNFTMDTVFRFNNLLPCTKYTVQVTPISIKNNEGTVATVSGKETSSSAPGAVNDLIADQITTNSVLLTWSAPSVNPSCVQYYKVITCHENVCNKTDIEANSANLFYNVTRLEPCLTYSFTVSAVGTVGSSDPVTINANTSSVTPGEPNSIEITPGQFSLFISWEPPITGSTCTDHYRISHWIGTNSAINTTRTKETYITISDLSACTSYTVQIIAVSPNNSDSPPRMVPNTTQESVTDPPTLEVQEPVVTKNSVSIVWRIDRTNNECELKTLRTICKFKSTDGSGIDPADSRQSEYKISAVDVTINITVSDLSPFSSYTCAAETQNVAGYSNSSIPVTVTTLEDAPSAPTILAVSYPNSSAFMITWDRPQYLAGNLIEHEIRLSWDRRFLRPSSCIDDDSTTSRIIDDIDGSVFEYHYLEATAYSEYSVSVRSRTNAGWGTYSDDMFVNTTADVPGAVTDINYSNKSSLHNPNVLDTFLSWKLPCSLNGEVELFSISYKGIRDGFDDDIGSKEYNDVVNITAEERFTINLGELKAEFNYTFEIYAKVKGISEHGAVNSYNVIYPAGMPPFLEEWYYNKIKIDPYKAMRTSSTAAILLPIFKNTNGEIIYYAIMVSEIGTKHTESRFDILGGHWPNTSSWKEAMSHTPISLYQATPVRWYPDKIDYIEDNVNLKAVEFILGTNDSCKKLPIGTYCNGPLRSDTMYQVRMRAFTYGGYRDSDIFFVKTKAEFNLGMVIGVVFGILFLGIITTMMLLIRKGVLQTALGNILHSGVQSSPGPEPFTRKKFELHCKELVEHRGKLSNEFQLLQTLSVDLEMSSNVAELQANRKKNRYINILPYDISRVKLDIVNNDPNSDYINASLIPGYTGATEYIACQGPKEETTYDFWRMIYQYNVKVIVMVTQLVEKGKDKCYQYYPNTRESFEHEDIMTRCGTQLDFEFYTQRIITLQKGGIKRTVTHLHFKDWPDHGVPDDFHPMINFCQIVRKLVTESKSLAVVHCSAGVGRTGTLIALDILLQQIRDNKKLDVFGTVYRLRQHRMHMVQTEDQYAYIYNCTKQALSNPYPPKNHKSSCVEPVYENLTKKNRNITDSNTNLVNSAETLKRVTSFRSNELMEPICEITVPQRPIYASQLSTLSLRCSKSSSAINTQVPSNLDLAKYGSYEYPIYEPAPDSPLSKVNTEMNSFIEFARPIRIETEMGRPESIHLDETTDQSIYRVRPRY